MSFHDLALKTKYDSDEDDILRQFYIPLLGCASKYDRAVGYFSAKVLATAAGGLEKFICSNGYMRLIIGDPLTDDEYDAVMKGLKEKITERSVQFSEFLLNADTRGLKILAYLIANGQLEIKFAFTHQGMFHKKVGIFHNENESVVFSGSANETLAGLTKYNSEEISVFFSWHDSFHDYGQCEIDNFERLWTNKKSSTKVVGLASETYQKIRAGINLNELYKDIFDGQVREENSKTCENIKEEATEKKVDAAFVFFKYSRAMASQLLTEIALQQPIPTIPAMINGRCFHLFEHQESTILKWISAGHHGLFKLATGSGKTFTSISAIVKVYEQRMREELPTFTVISVPYIELANQWVKELSVFNIFAISCYDGKSKWLSELHNKILRYKTRGLSFICCVVVNKTFTSTEFQVQLDKIPSEQLFFVGDECHHLGGDNIASFLPNAHYRIGLSATPFRNDDEEIDTTPFPDSAKKNLVEYFGGIVSEYSLSDAIKDGVLSKYTYHLVPVYLTESEQEQYEEYSDKIRRLVLKSNTLALDSQEKLILTSLCNARSRLLATCEGKLPALVEYLISHSDQSFNHSLIYVGEGCAPGDEKPYITKVTNLLDDNGLRVAKFTAEENNNERKQIMDNFKNNYIDALVAMKVLDEGIDVPVCRTAFILASSRNPRQYVQRRGRVLRRAEGKDSALIVDFVVLPNDNRLSIFSQKLKSAERERVLDFKFTASNPEEVEKQMIKFGII